MPLSPDNRPALDRWLARLFDDQFVISGARMQFGAEGERRTAKFDLAVFVGDERQLLVGQTWQTVELKLERERYDRFMRNLLPITLTVPIRRSASYAKIIVYDYGSDLLGTAHVKVRKKK